MLYRKTCWPRLLFVLLFLLPNFIWVRSALAQSQSGQYQAGTGGQMKSPILTPPGIYLNNSFFNFWDGDFVNSSGNKSGSDITTIVNRTALIWNTGLKIFEGDYFVGASIPFRYVFFNKNSNFGLGDVTFQPVGIGWHFDRFHARISYSLFAPTGEFNFRRNDNLGKGFWSHLFVAGAAYTSKSELPWNAMIQLVHEIPTEQRDTGIVPARALIWEYAAGKTILSNLDLGMAGFAAWQITNQAGPFIADPTKYQYFGIGPELSVRIPKWRMSISARNYFLFGSVNALEGNYTILSLRWTL